MRDLKKRLADWVKLLRIKHWIKNLLVLFPLAFSGDLVNPTMDVNGILGLLTFCLLSSSVYILNDLRDVEADRAHPRKKYRPIASGSIKAPSAIVIAMLMTLCSFALGYLISAEPILSTLILVCYAIINIAYSAGLKHVPIAEIVILSIGFLLRVLFGSTILGIAISSWMFLCVLALALFLSLGKRRGELNHHGASSRKSLERYSIQFLDKNMYMFLGMGLVFYSLWTFSRIDSIMLDGSALLLVSSIPLAMFICLKYSFDIEVEANDGDPVEVVFGDWSIILMILLWGISVGLGIYL